MTDRRTFLRRGAIATGALAATPHALLAAEEQILFARRLATDVAAGATSPGQLARDEAFWARLRRSFALHRDIVNLDHGWTNPTPRAALDEVFRQAAALQQLPAERLANLWEEVFNTDVRAAVARVLGVPGDQFAFVRNATEALDTVLLGVPLSAGDEIVCSAHDYYAMLDALEQRRARDGVVLRMIRPPVPASSPDDIAALYEAEIGARTRLVLVTSPSNLTGQYANVQRIAAAAHAAGAEVVLDGAQSLGLHEESIASFDCDYYGASLHKWLGVPVGMGVLWMRPEHTEKVWPLVPPPPGTTGMSRYEWIGTAPDYLGPAALPALAVHESVGAARKAARLRYLTGYWRERAAAALPQARFYTRPDPAQSVGLCTLELPGVDPTVLQQRLLKEHRILVQDMTDIRTAPEIRGIRVSPNVYSAPAELDRFVGALVAATR